jgi:hypothetical protein
VLQLKISSEFSFGIRSNSACDQIAPWKCYDFKLVCLFHSKRGEPVAGMLLSAASDLGVNSSNQ